MKQSYKHELNFEADFGLKALKIALNLEQETQFKGHEIQMRRSSSGRGWHFRVKNYLVYPELHLAWRRRIGDCYGRFKADLARASLGHRIGILFSCKNGLKANAWEALSPKKVYEESFVVLTI